MVCSDFTYDGISLASFNMITVKSDEDPSFPTRSISKSNITTVRPMANQYSVQYEDNQTLNFLIVKNDCVYTEQEDQLLTGEEINSLRSWLESPKVAKRLVIENGGKQSKIIFNGLFTSVQPYVVGDMCYGLKLKFEADSPYGYIVERLVVRIPKSNIATDTHAYTDKQLYDITGATNRGTNDVSVTPLKGSDGSYTFSFNNSSCEKYEYVIPVIQIAYGGDFGDNCSIEITNTTGKNRPMKIKCVKDKCVMRVDCVNKIISTVNANVLPVTQDCHPVSDTMVAESSSESYFSSITYNYNWIDFVHGTNTIKIKPLGLESSLNITFIATAPMKQGEFYDAHTYDPYAGCGCAIFDIDSDLNLILKYPISDDAVTFVINDNGELIATAHDND